MNYARLAAAILTALLAAAPVLAQGSPPPGSGRGAAPTFHSSTDSRMNMMMTNGAIAIAPVPGERLLSRRVSGQGAVLVYAGTRGDQIFNFYDRAIRSEGWMPTAMNGKMLDDKMAGSTMRQAKPDDKMATGGGMMAGNHAMTPGAYSATYSMGGHAVDLQVSASGGRVTVSFKSQ